MAETTIANVGNALVRIHKVITRALIVSIEQVQGGGPEPGLRDGFQRYLRALSIALHAHHLGEDEVAFPFWQQRDVSLPLVELTHQHRQIEPLLEELNAWLQLDETAWTPASLGALHTSLKTLEALWHDHITLEEKHMSAQNATRYLTPEENRQLSADLAAHGQQHAQPSPLVLPFVLYNLGSAEREEMAATLPPPVLQLIPGEWKATWAPMGPFLLQ